MQRYEVGVAFLDDKGAEGEAQSYVVECVGFGRGVIGEYCGGNGELEGWGHVVSLLLIAREIRMACGDFGSAIAQRIWKMRILGVSNGSERGLSSESDGHHQSPVLPFMRLESGVRLTKLPRSWKNCSNALTGVRSRYVVVASSRSCFCLAFVRFDKDWEFGLARRASAPPLMSR